MTAILNHKNKKTMANKAKKTMTAKEQQEQAAIQIKSYRLNQIGGNAPLTLEQRRQVAKKLHCTANYVEAALDTKYPALSYQIMLEAAKVLNATDYVQKYTRLVTVLFCMLLGAATANAQSVQIGNIKIEYNEAAAAFYDQQVERYIAQITKCIETNTFRGYDAGLYHGCEII